MVIVSGTCKNSSSHPVNKDVEPIPTNIEPTTTAPANPQDNLLVTPPSSPSPEKAAALESKILEWIDQPQQSQQFLRDSEQLTQAGASITPEKASELLEKTLEKAINNPQQLDHYQPIISILQNQRPTPLDPARVQTLLERSLKAAIDPSNPAASITPIIDLLQKQAITLTTEQANVLLQEAIHHAQITLYSRLLDLGANPNTTIKTDQGEQEALLKYANRKDLDLLQALIKHPKTDINKPIYEKSGFTLAMKAAYKEELDLLKALLKRQDLDINTIKGTAQGAKKYTLLDMVVQNAVAPLFLENRLGNEAAKKNAIERSEQWLNLLKQMTAHPNFFVKQRNIDRALHRSSDLYNYLSGWLNFDEDFRNKSVAIAYQVQTFLEIQKKAKKQKKA